MRKKIEKLKKRKRKKRVYWDARFLSTWYSVIDEIVILKEEKI